MAVLTLATNRTIPAAPPAYFFPTAAGRAVPAGLRRWTLSFDQTNVPAGSTYAVTVQYQRVASWTDKSGAVHPANEWLDDASATFSGGVIHLKGGDTFINTLSSTIGATGSDGNMVEPYPDNARIRVDSMNATWVWPSITLTVV